MRSNQFKFSSSRLNKFWIANEPLRAVKENIVLGRLDHMSQKRKSVGTNQDPSKLHFIELCNSAKNSFTWSWTKHLLLLLWPINEVAMLPNYCWILDDVKRAVLPLKLKSFSYLRLFMALRLFPNRCLSDGQIPDSTLIPTKA